MTTIVNDIAALLNGLAANIANVVQTELAGAIQSIADTVETVVEAAVQAGLAGINASIGLLQSTIQSAFSLFTSTLSTVITTITDIFDTLKDDITAIVVDAVDEVRDLGETLQSELRTLQWGLLLIIAILALAIVGIMMISYIRASAQAEKEETRTQQLDYIMQDRKRMLAA